MKLTNLIAGSLVTMLALSGCDSEQAQEEIAQEIENSKILQGVIADVAGATVCADENENEQCDANEPTTISDVDGSYSLEVEDENIQVLAEVTPESINLENNQPFGERFTMVSVKGKHQFISSMTTLMSEYAKEYTSLSSEEIEQLLREEYQIEGSLFENYTQKKDALQSKMRKLMGELKSKIKEHRDDRNLEAKRDAFDAKFYEVDNSVLLAYLNAGTVGKVNSARAKLEDTDEKRFVSYEKIDDSTLQITRTLPETNSSKTPAYTLNNGVWEEQVLEAQEVVNYSINEESALLFNSRELHASQEVNLSTLPVDIKDPEGATFDEGSYALRLYAVNVADQYRIKNRNKAKRENAQDTQISYIDENSIVIIAEQTFSTLDDFVAATRVEGNSAPLFRNFGVVLNEENVALISPLKSQGKAAKEGHWERVTVDGVEMIEVSYTLEEETVEAIEEARNRINNRKGQSNQAKQNQANKSRTNLPKEVAIFYTVHNENVKIGNKVLAETEHKVKGLLFNPAAYNNLIQE
jgi:hypothetical protein